jgi:glycosyltransferase involved in cell wall biosynthesis
MMEPQSRIPEFSGTTVSIVIPAHNERDTIRNIVAGCLPYGEVIVVDDGSTDDTSAQATEAGTRANPKLVILHKNFGYSYAIKKGYEASTGEIIALVDADGQQNPDELHRLLSPILNDEADMVIGSKILGTMDYEPAIANSLMNETWQNLILWRFGVNLTHPFSGMRAMRKSCIDMSALKSNRFESMLELDISFIKNGYRILEVPRVARARTKGKSHVTLADGLRVMWRGAQLLL